MSGPLYGAIEGGGTKFICALGAAPDRILERANIETTDPAHHAGRLRSGSSRRVSARTERSPPSASAASVRIAAAAGSRRLRPHEGDAETGLVRREPARAAACAFRVPIELDTDVGAAALAEWRLGAGRDVGSLAYVTVGTGIGGALCRSIRRRDG